MNLYFSKKNRRYAGFSFIELMVVIAISSILLTISVISFSATRKSTIVNAAQEEVFSALKMAKGYALQGKMPDAATSACGHNSICGYGFNFTSATQYQVFYYYSCDVNGKLDCSNPTSTTKVAVDAQTLKNSATLIKPTPATLANTVVYFSIPWGTMQAALSREYEVGFVGKTKKVDINATGLIYLGS